MTEPPTDELEQGPDGSASGREPPEDLSGGTSADPDEQDPGVAAAGSDDPPAGGSPADDAETNPGDVDDLPSSSQPGEMDASQREAGQQQYAEFSKGSSSGPVTSVGSVTAGGDVHFHGTRDREEASAIETLSRSHFRERSREELAEIASWALCEEEEIRRVTTTLAHRRVVVLGGRPDIGKGIAACLVAHRYLQRSGGRVTVLECRGIGPHVRVYLEKIAAERKTFGRSVLLLPNVFDSNNEYLTRSFEGLGEDSLPALERRLQEQETALILTSDPARIPASLGRLEALGILEEIEGPGEETRREGLHRKISWLEERDGGKSPAVWREIEGWPEERFVELACALGGMPAIDRYVLDHLVAVVGGEISPEEALARAREPRRRYLASLTSHPERWSAALALALVQAAPLGGAPWTQFYSLWRRISDVVRRAQRRRTTELTLDQLGADGDLLRPLGAVVTRRGTPPAAWVRFRESGTLETVWSELLGEGRAALSLVTPLLQQLVEDKDLYLRQAAARGLGRIGEVDAPYYAPPFIRSCLASSASPARSRALGPFIQGVWGSANGGYRERCLDWLRSSSSSDQTRAVWVKADAYGDLGTCDPARGVQELGALLSRQLGNGIENRLEKADRGLREATVSVRGQAVGQAGPEVVEDLTDVMVGRWFGQVFPKKGRGSRALAAVQYSLIGISIAKDPVHVLGLLRAWLRKPKSARALALAFQLLKRRGILQTLDHIRVGLAELGAEDRSRKSCGLVLATLFLDPSAREQLVQFLEDLMPVIRGRPELLRIWLQDELDKQLKAWAWDSVRAGPLVPSVEQLFVSLLDSRDEGLKEGVFRLLRDDSDFTAPDSHLHRFALRVLRRRRQRGQLAPAG